MRGKMGKLVEFMHGRIKPRSSVEALHTAAFEDDIDTIKSLVKDGNVDIDARLSTVMGASTTQTPLFLAIQEGNISSARLLVEHGAEIDHVNDIGITPLMVAASHGDLAAVKILLSLGASPNYFRQGDGATPLSFCARSDAGEATVSSIALELINAGADVELPPYRSQSVLMLAARENRPKLIELLLQAGADPDRKCTLKWAMNWTALDHAINERSAEAEEILALVTRSRPLATSGCVK